LISLFFILPDQSHFIVYMFPLTRKTSVMEFYIDNSRWYWTSITRLSW